MKKHDPHDESYAPVLDPDIMYRRSDFQINDFEEKEVTVNNFNFNFNFKIIIVLTFTLTLLGISLL